MAEPTVFVVDDDPAVRTSLAQMIERRGLPVQCFPSAEAFLEAYEDSHPGCLVVDVRMPGMGGLELQEELADDDASLPIIVITGHGDIPMGVRAMKQGAVDFLEKPYHPEELSDSIEQALALDARRRQQRSWHTTHQSHLAELTRSEREVMERIASGKQNKQIASDLDFSLRTVELRWAAIRKKLDVDSRAALATLLASLERPVGQV